ncbi:MAG: hypothetical protein AAF513_15775 [Pseudomonadota bacterium]
MFSIVGFVCLSACEEGSTRGLDLETGSHSITPNLVRGGEGRLVLSFLEVEEELTHLRYAQLDGAVWGPVETVVSSQDMLRNWADFASVLPLREGGIAAHWLVKSSTGFTYDAYVARRARDAPWTPPTRLHADQQLTEHGFVSLFEDAAGLGAIWLDGNQYPRGLRVMELRSATLDERGQPYDEVVVDQRVCDCCQTTAAIVGGQPVIAYRDRADDEIRDISIAQYTESGWQVLGPVAADGWRITGCPVNGPVLSAHDSRLALAWFTGMPSPRVRLALSSQGGESFEVLDIADSNVIGRVDASAFAQGVVVSWMGAGGVHARFVSWSGEKHAVHTLAEVDTSRRAGFAQIAVIDTRLIYAWTDTRAPQLQVRTAYKPLAELVSAPG